MKTLEGNNGEFSTKSIHLYCIFEENDPQKSKNLDFRSSYTHLTLENGANIPLKNSMRGKERVDDLYMPMAGFYCRFIVI